MDDEADIYEGVRAQFPLSFGKQSKSQTPLELVHNATRRTTATSTAANDKPSDSKKIDAFPSLSSSSQDWINSFKNSNPRNSSRGSDVSTLVGPPRPPKVLDEEDEKLIGPPTGSGGAGNENEEPRIGPPRPPPRKVENDDDEPTIGPPRPPPGKVEDGDDDDDGPTIGPPKPPPGAIDSDEDEDSDEDANADEEDDDPGYRVPLSNEIVLKGHTKVKHLADQFPWILLIYTVNFFYRAIAA